MFDVVPLTNLALTGVKLHVFSTGPMTIQLYTKVGTHVGSEQTPSAWTLVETKTVTSAGLGAQTDYQLSSPLTLTANERRAFYVTITEAGLYLAYTRDTRAVGTLYTSNSNLEIYIGTGNRPVFDVVFQPRVWNGVLEYRVA